MYCIIILGLADDFFFKCLWFLLDLFSMSYLCVLCGLKLSSANMEREDFLLVSSGFGAFWNYSKSNGGGFFLLLLFFFWKQGQKVAHTLAFHMGDIIKHSVLQLP